VRSYYIRVASASQTLVAIARYVVKVKLFLCLIKHWTLKTYEVVDAVLCPSHFTMHIEPPLPFECKATKCIIKKNIYSTCKGFEVWLSDRNSV
jgi:hypothetical protein